MPAARPMKRAGPRSWRDRKRPARCSGWRSIPTVCGYIMMTMAVDVASRAGAHQPGFRRHVNTFTVAIALEQFDKATVNGRARVLSARPDKIADLHAVEHEAGSALRAAAGTADALIAIPGVECNVGETGALQKIGYIVLFAQRKGTRLARLRRGEVDMPADRGHDIALPRIVGDRRPHRDVEPSTRSEEHTSELQSLMRISYAVFCLKKKTHTTIKLLTTINS